MISYRQADLLNKLQSNLKTIVYIYPKLINQKLPHAWYTYGNAIAWNRFPVNKLGKMPMAKIKCVVVDEDIVSCELTNREDIDKYLKDTGYKVFDVILNKNKELDVRCSQF